MTNTMAAPITPTAPADRARSTTRALLAAGAAAGPLFLAVGVVGGLTREGFDFTRNALSQLSLGDLGWIQQTAFLLTGLLTVTGAVGLRLALPAGVWAPRLVGVFGAAFVLDGFFAADPGAGFPVGAPEGRVTELSAHGTVHLIGGAVGFLALCAAFLVLARHLDRGWALASRLVAAAVLLGFAASGATVLAFTLGAALGLGWLTAVTVKLNA
ncbi:MULTISPECIES: DUF998 domain-containing protein [unclassified Streptomyces]|uniref:DUF998 domain-containing protein n=1 Tax=Streptomycetaceae TaxID=2062 RepID=UPI002E793D53|nr:MULTISPECIES: DUF998 domain-containing protein [unclassified Streptomyces]MED7951629.1 DUF998 domain-containing protein [Streptomyces sp. BE303]MEE1829034.1 DUF998 domain-containing protein [Streptomyces sp. BE20]